MSAGAPRGRTLMRPSAQHLSLSLVEHPSFKFRTFGAYEPLATPATLTPIDDEDDDMDLPLSLNRGPRLNDNLLAPPSACKLGVGLTPFTAMTAGSAYSQDSYIEPEVPGIDTDTDTDTDLGLASGNAGSYPLRSLNCVRVDTRRFGMALSPNAKFTLPLASASFPSATVGTLVPNLQSLETGEAEEPSSSLVRHVPHAIHKAISETPAASPPTLQNDKITEAAPQLPVVTKGLKRDPPVATTEAPRSTKSAKVTINRSVSLRSSAKGLTRLFSRVSLPTHLSRNTSGNKRQTAKGPPPKRQTTHPVPAVPDPLGDESLMILDLKNSKVQTDASDNSIPGTGAFSSSHPCQTTVFSTTDSPEQISRHTGIHSESVDFHDTLPAIEIGPLEITFGGSIDWVP